MSDAGKIADELNGLFALAEDRFRRAGLVAMVSTPLPGEGDMHLWWGKAGPDYCLCLATTASGKQKIVTTPMHVRSAAARAVPELYRLAKEATAALVAEMEESAELLAVFLDEETREGARKEELCKTA